MPPKRKGKGRAAEPTSHDEFMEAASYQEDQATRYQFGDKAQRHYEEAARLYAAALQLPGLTQDEQYDTQYNLARILYTLATEIYGPPKCYDFLKQAIDAFRACDVYTVSDKTDAAFNLAQALQTLGEYVSESVPSSSIYSLPKPETIWTEARQILEAVRQDQLSRLSTVNPPVDVSEEESLEGEVGLDAETAAVEEQVVTPSTVIETIIASIQAAISIAETTGKLDETDLLDLFNAATRLDAAGGYMASEIRAVKHEMVKVQMRLQLERGEAPNVQGLQDTINEQREAVMSSRRPDPAGLSDLADTLVLAAEAMLAGSTSVEPPRQLVGEALSLYSQARSILGNPLQRPSSTPAHHVPALLSANYQSCAQAHILLAIPDSSNSTQLNEAKRLALEGLNSTDGTFKALPPTANGPVKFAKNLRSAQREDYRTISATRDSVLTIVRVFLLDRLLNRGTQPFGEQERGLQALLKATWPDANDLKHVLEEYVRDIQTDGIGRLIQKQLGTSEQPVWSEFVNVAN